MLTWRMLQGLGPMDVKNLARDPILRWLFFYPLLIAVLVRWGIPLLAAYLRNRYQFDLDPYYPLLMSFVLLMTPMLAGMVIGFLLLDQRDDQTLAALLVTPLSLNSYLLYRLGMPALVGLLMTLFIFPLTGLMGVGWIHLLLAALCAAPLAALYALTLAVFAANKVQGFALAKALGVFLPPTLIAYFVDPPWQWAFGLVPLYWPSRLLWLEGIDAGFWVYLIVGLLYQAALMALLLRLLNKRGVG